jgi:hypothetical protein
MKAQTGAARRSLEGFQSLADMIDLTIDEMLWAIKYLGAYF